MKYFKNNVIIGIDHGYGNIKTANHIFRTGVIASDAEPVFGTNILRYNGKYYLVGEGHKEFSADKITDEEYFLTIFNCDSHCGTQFCIVTGKVAVTMTPTDHIRCDAKKPPFPQKNCYNI